MSTEKTVAQAVLKFVNWDAVSKIEDKDGGWCFKMAICNLAAGSPIGSRLRQAFPEYFLEVEDNSLPISWARLVHEGRSDLNSDQNRFPDELDTRGILDKYNIPTVRYSGTLDNHEDWDFPLLPKDIARQCAFGRVIKYEGDLYVVTECNYIKGQTPTEIALSPLTCFKMEG